jgi:hypothetical protein
MWLVGAIVWRIALRQGSFTLTGNRNRSSIFAFVAFSDGKRILLFLKML